MLFGKYYTYLIFTHDFDGYASGVDAKVGVGVDLRVYRAPRFMHNFRSRGLSFVLDWLREWAFFRSRLTGGISRTNLRRNLTNSLSAEKLFLY